LSPQGVQGGLVTAELIIMFLYRFMALLVAGMMLFVLWRDRDWRTQCFATLVFVPFLLRAFGIK